MRKFGIKIVKEVFPAARTPTCSIKGKNKTTNFGIPLSITLREEAEYKAGILPFEHERYLGG